MPPLVSRANSYRQALSINHLSYLVSPAMQKRPALALIGAGEVRISVSAHRSIKRWRLLLPLLCIIGTVLGVAYILGPVLRPDSFPELLDKVEAIVQGACFVVLPWIGLGGWAFSMIIATKLCCDHIIEVLQAVVATQSLSSEEDKSRWRAEVTEPSIALIKQIALLSYGWGRGAVAFVAFSSLMGLAYFARAVNLPHEAARDALNDVAPGTSRMIDLALASIWVSLPLLLIVPLAQTSSYCKKLMASLNQVRLDHHFEGHEQVYWIEQGLARLNDAQGL